MDKDKCVEKLMDVQKEIAVIKEHIEMNKDILEKTYTKLFGNGQEGLLTTVTKHKVYFALISAAVTIMAGCITIKFI